MFIFTLLVCQGLKGTHPNPVFPRPPAPWQLELDCARSSTDGFFPYFFFGWCLANESTQTKLWLSLFSPSAAAAYLFQRQLSPTPGYPSQYQLYAMENTRQTILNDYITSQQMQVGLRPDVARGLSPREQQLGLPYPATRGVCLCRLEHVRPGSPRHSDKCSVGGWWKERKGHSFSP